MDADADGAEGSRSPTAADLARVGRSLEEHGARYVILGGIAMQFHGLERATKDLDLLIDPAPENVDRVKRALAVLSDQASLEVLNDDVEKYAVVRIADEIVVDLLGSACGVTYASVAQDIEIGEIDGVRLPFLTPEALIRTKQTVRPQDAADCGYLERLLHDEG